MQEEILKIIQKTFRKNRIGSAQQRADIEGNETEIKGRCLLDEKTVLFDTVDWSACRQLLENLVYVLDGRELDYLVVNHLEPDHAACIEEILLRHPKVKLISNEKAFMLMRQFGFHVDGHECIEVKEGDTFSFGKHTVTFVGAPMVHLGTSCNS